MNTKGLKSLVEKFFEESLMSSSYMKKITDNIVLIALETKKIAEHMQQMNERLNKHEEAILKLIDLQQEKHDVVDYIKVTNKEEPSKPN